MISLFLETSPALMSEIEAGIARQDARTIECASHALKGALQTINAVPAAQAAANLELAGRQGDYVAASPSFVALTDQYDRLIDALSDHCVGAQT